MSRSEASPAPSPRESSASDPAHPDTELSGNTRPDVPLWRGLSGRLLLLTVLFVMISEVLIYAPSIARFRQSYLQEQLDDALLALAAAESVPSSEMASQVAEQLLDRSGAYLIGVHYVDMSGRQGPRMILSRRIPSKIDAEYNLMNSNIPSLILDAFDCLFQSRDRMLRIKGSASRYPSARIEVVLPEAELQREMIDYSGRILLLSLFIAFITASCLFLSLQWLLIRPMRRLTRHVIAFGRNPESGPSLRAGRRTDEIGAAERALARMQTDLRGALLQKTRLAALGIAVAKFNHDLRNILASGMLYADRLSMSPDEQTSRSAEKLITIIERATALCQHSLKFARDGAPEINPRPFPLSSLARKLREDMPMPLEVSRDITRDIAETRARMEAAQGSPLDEETEIRLEEETEALYRGSLLHLDDSGTDMILSGDLDQLLRAFGNILRNAVEAGATSITVSMERQGDTDRILVSDNGPGLPDQARENLFRPFQGSARQGGTGLGLAIARDILNAHGGNITLQKSDSEGTCFCLTLPAPQE